jgi:hypothetical protein
MGWVKLDDRWAGHPKVTAVSFEARFLYIAGLCYCTGYRTDGLIPRNQVEAFGVPDAMERAEELVEASLWEREGDDLRVHDYLLYQISKAADDERRANDRSRKEKSRKKKVEKAPQGIRSDSAQTGGKESTGNPSGNGKVLTLPDGRRVRQTPTGETINDDTGEVIWGDREIELAFAEANTEEAFGPVERVDSS